MHNSSFSRYNLLWKLILCYLLPLITVNLLYSQAEGVQDRWNVISLGLFLSIIGTLAIFWMMTRWESLFISDKQPFSEPIIQAPAPGLSASVEPVNTNELDEAQELNHQLSQQIDAIKEQLHHSTLQEEASQHKLINLEDENRGAFEQLELQQRSIRELQDQIAEQKGITDKRQQQIVYLETKVSDLTYEIKTLLKLAETYTTSFETESLEKEASHLTVASPEPAPEPNANSEILIQTPEEASLQLKRCLDIAQKITGSYRFNSHGGNFMDASIDSFTFDLRRLCDRLRIENGCTILLYSSKENQVLFVNNQIKNSLGWSPEKFTHNFSEILQDFPAWKQGVSSLSTRSEAQIKLPFKTKSGQDLLMSVHLSLVPTGIFRQYIIAVLYSSKV